jgi:hypothetical protein
MENPQNSKITGVEEILNAVKAFGNEKGIIIDIQLPGDVQMPVELWSTAKTKADTRAETKQRKKWKEQTQGKGRLLLSGKVNALETLDALISEISRPVQMLRLREVIDVRYRARIKMKLYFLSATWRPRDNEDDGATVKVDLTQLWQRKPPALSKALEKIYNFQVYDNPESLVVRLVPQQH